MDQRISDGMMHLGYGEGQNHYVHIPIKWQVWCDGCAVNMNKTYGNSTWIQFRHATVTAVLITKIFSTGVTHAGFMPIRKFMCYISFGESPTFAGSSELKKKGFPWLTAQIKDINWTTHILTILR